MRAPVRVLPDYEALHSLLTYSPETGELLWKMRKPITPYAKGFNKKFANKPAGSLAVPTSCGHRYLAVGLRMKGKQQQYGAHRVIYKMMTGKEPPHPLDHKDGNVLNNKWDNLRPSTNNQNIYNSRLRKDNKSGVKGVTWWAQMKKWRADIAHNKVKYYLGKFSSIEEAKRVVDKKRAELHQEFAKYS